MAYSDSEKATALAALDANGGNVAATARQLKIPRKTLDGWKAGTNVHEEVAEIRQEKKRDLADEMEKIALNLVDAIPDKIKEASLQQTATSLGIAVDKMQLLRGKPTAINQDGEMTPEQRKARIDELNRRRGTGATPAP